MSKQVEFNGIEINASEDNISTKNLFDFAEDLMGKLGSEMDDQDQNFSMQIHTDFYSNRPPKHRVFVNGLSSERTRIKLIRILKRTTTIFTDESTMSLNINLAIHD